MLWAISGRAFKKIIALLLCFALPFVPVDFGRDFSSHKNVCRVRCAVIRLEIYSSPSKIFACKVAASSRFPWFVAASLEVNTSWRWSQEVELLQMQWICHCGHHMPLSGLIRSVNVSWR
jgi:hypothetical protein